ncbi:MAG: hypothetical protein ACHQLA_05695 [Ignavibacteriales bacterium]
MKHIKIIFSFFIILYTGNSFPQNEGSLETDPVNITAAAIINKYIDAIGGKEKFTGVMDKTTVMTGSAMDQPINVVIKQKYPDKLFQELQAGEVKQFLYYSGGKGTMKVGDEQIILEGKELERLTMDATMQLLINPDSFNVQLEFMGIECIDSTDSYIVRFILPSGIRWFQYFDFESGLKIKETKEIQTKQGLFEQETYFSDYREVTGLKFPFKIRQYLGIQEIELTVTKIEINTGIDDSVFEVQ